MRYAIIAVLLLTGTAFGQLFAVGPGPRLVTVDPDSGGVDEIGALLLDGNVAGMEFVGQRLFATESFFPNGAYLVEIDPRDATVLSRHAITLDGQPLSNAIEGLGYDVLAGSLVQAFWQPGAFNVSSSTTMGYIGLDGAVSSPITFSVDFDGLATRGADGSMYWVDREPGPNTLEIGVVTVGGSPSSLALYSFSGTLNGVNDVSFASDRGELLAVDAVTSMVHRFDPASAALLGSVGIETGEGFNGAAYRVRCDADLAPPFGVLDLADINAFVGGFLSQGSAADLNNDGVWDLQDIGLFVGAFVGGCP